MCFLPDSKSQISQWFIHEGRPVIDFRKFSFNTSPGTCLNWLQMIRSHGVPLSPVYLILWWCFPGENSIWISIWISLNKTRGWLFLTLITWNFSKHTGARHQVDTSNTGGNMCSFWRGRGGDSARDHYDPWDHPSWLLRGATHSNREARRNCLDSTADSIILHTFAEINFAYHSDPQRH